MNYERKPLRNVYFFNLLDKDYVSRHGYPGIPGLFDFSGFTDNPNNSRKLKIPENDRNRISVKCHGTSDL